MKTCAQLLNEFTGTGENPRKLTFTGVGDNDVYNISAPFKQGDDLIIAGRVEARDSEHSQIIFFTPQDGHWVPKDGAPTLMLQDPFFTFIGEELVLGGVEIYPHPENPDALAWRTVFYKGGDIYSLEVFFKGPDGMKDLRIAELADKRIAVVTRPQGEKGGRGKIGYASINDLSELTLDVIHQAPLLEGQFIDEEWGGANELHVLKNGQLGVLGHIASFSEGDVRHYYPMVFVIDPETGAHSEIQLIATRSQFLPGSSKRPDLIDVVFSGGLVRNEDKTADLYAGISDAEAHVITIVDPFLKYENESVDFV